MATKKTTTETTEAVETVETTVEKTVEQYGWEDMRTITLPRPARNEAKSVFVSVNGRNYNVPKGKAVEVPYPIYERLDLMLKAQQAEDEYRDTIPNEA